MKLFLAFLIAGFGFCQATAPTATNPPAEKAARSNPVSVDLVADVAAVRPGASFTLGVRFRMQPEWHVYWKNPGDAGLPVSLKLTGPDGTSFGSMQWPVPIRFEQPGEIVGYGYTGTVVFPVEVHVPESLPAGTSARIGVDASWLVCKDVCIPGKATVDITLPVAASASQVNADLFAGVRRQLPMQTDPSVVTVRTESGIRGATGKGAVSVQLDWKDAPSSVEFFPSAEDALVVENVKVEQNGAHAKISFDAEILPGLDLSSDKLETVVVYTDARGDRRGITVPVPLRAADR